jgi:hypothetical protein
VAVLAVAAWAAPETVVEDWGQGAPGARGVPPGWRGESWGKPSGYDLTIVDDDGHRALRLRSDGDRVTISVDLKGRVDLRDTPILEWAWKVTVLPRGGDSRVRATADQAAQIYVVWPRVPALLRSRIIGYAWDTQAPAGSVFRSRKTGTVTYVIVRSGVADLGHWITERRDVAEDYRRIYGEEPKEPGALSLSIDSNDTRSSAESFIGSLVFRPPS